MTSTKLQDQVAATLSMYEAAMAPGVAEILRAEHELKPLSTKFAELTRALAQQRLIDLNVKGWPLLHERVKDLSPAAQSSIASIGHGLQLSGNSAEATKRLSFTGPKGLALLAALRDAAPVLDTPAAPQADQKASVAPDAPARPISKTENAGSLSSGSGELIPVAIIGTAGRKDDASRINRPLYDAMVADAETRIRQNCANFPVRAVSGGAAVSDHVAVSLFLKGAVKELSLHLPAEFENCRFIETPAKGNFDPARTANYYHGKFKEKTGIDGLAEIAAAMKKPGCTVQITPGFKERNTLVAREGKLLVAYTFGEGAKTETVRQGEAGYTSSSAAGLKDGGTADTWQKSNAAIKVHVPLHLLETTHSLEKRSPAPSAQDNRPMKDLKGHAVEWAYRTSMSGIRNIVVYVEQPDRPNQPPVRAIIWGGQRVGGDGPVREFEAALNKKLSGIEGSDGIIILGQNGKLEISLKGHWRKDEFKNGDGKLAQSWRFDVKSWELGQVKAYEPGSKENAAKDVRSSGRER